MTNFLHQSYLSLMKAHFKLSDVYEIILHPLKPTYLFDLVGFRDNKFERIKVIYTEYKTKYGIYEANLRKSGGYSKANTLKESFDPSTCEYLFIDTP